MPGFKTTAEEINAAAAANAQTVNRDAAGLVAPTTTPLADDSLPSGFGKDATGRIFKLGDTSQTEPVISSDANASEFDKNKTDLDRRLANLGTVQGDNADTATDGADGKKELTYDDKTNTIEGTTGSKLEDSINADLEAERTAFEEKAAQRVKDYENIFTTSLASIDSTAAATINGLKATYNRRIEEQRRINNLRVDRVKAYGLGTDNARFVPQDFTDAVTLREEEAANEIASLEGQRDSLIAQAEAAARAGRSDLMRDRMADLDKVEETLRSNLDRLQTESNKQYEILKTYRKEQEAEHKEKVEKMRQNFALLASSYLDQYDGKDDAAKDTLIKKIMAQTGLSYAEVYAEMEKASGTAAATQKESDKEKRGELRSVGSDLYQVTYDENGKAVTSLVQRGAKASSGGGSSSTKTTSSSGKTSDITLTPTDKKRMAAKGLDVNDQADVDRYIKEQYGDDEEVTEDEKILTFAEFENALVNEKDEKGNYLYNESNQNVKDVYDQYRAEELDRAAAKTLTKADKQAMLANKLNPEDPADVRKYFETKYAR